MLELMCVTFYFTTKLFVSLLVDCIFKRLSQSFHIFGLYLLYISCICSVYLLRVYYFCL